MVSKTSLWREENALLVKNMVRTTTELKHAFNDEILSAKN